MKTLQEKNKDSAGFITTDFLFAFILVISFAVVLFKITLTLSVIEMAQYITFASARNFFAAHISENKQRALAQQKYQSLLDNKEHYFYHFLGPHHRWFSISENPRPGNFSKLYPKASGPLDSSKLFQGVRINFIAQALNFGLPFLGNTTENGQPPTTFVNSYLGREPSSNECQIFNQQRFRKIINLNPAYQRARIQAYISISDNGC
ncbi:MAG: hypothetical protein D6797_01285 [Bdellovibrio sp.]|nr:MAG: hypothetical protein D6797_01285 [Bdellovibrio sp.]